MPITHYSYTVKYGCTENVGDYSNVRPELEITLSGEGNAEEALDEMKKMHQELRRQVHEIVDQEREWHDQQVRYDQGPLYSLVYAPGFHFLAIVAAEAELPEMWEARKVHGYEWLRYAHILRKVRRDSRFAQEDLKFLSPEELPTFSRFTSLLINRPDAAYLIILHGDFYRGAHGYPPLLLRWYEHSTRQKRVDMPLDIFLERMQQLAAKEGLTLINCLTADGENDFSVLPALFLEPESAPQEESDDIPFDEEDEDEEDEDENEI